MGVCGTQVLFERRQRHPPLLTAQAPPCSLCTGAGAWPAVWAQKRVAAGGRPVAAAAGTPGGDGLARPGAAGPTAAGAAARHWRRRRQQHAAPAGWRQQAQACRISSCCGCGCGCFRSVLSRGSLSGSGGAGCGGALAAWQAKTAACPGIAALLPLLIAVCGSVWRPAATPSPPKPSSTRTRITHPTISAHPPVGCR